ncbi:hypothetical protein M406DRAFT_251055 [Cryphonectria parasitica EP155]|uniref:non-specific serine/threonine protein kinase n=1 Tax=Cryphonectria parasitica (strain ATCC 38755 / EP155) TaxID=660469 RepID=A0A9P5CR87_CRYP1|nr:uncharacterized protein M406DRAFT_251055 [Cryphonectria parasitica EP155]KAF3768304.1 hypothetical protein M406DRAFT_251055 [Cryphonectria parasitica EP155]
MLDQQQQLIKDHPIGKDLDGFHNMFNSICDKAGISCTLDALEDLSQEDMQGLSSVLLTMLSMLPAARLLSSKSGYLRTDLIRLNSTTNSSAFDFDSVKPLLRSVLEHDADELIWDHICRLTTDVLSPQRTPPPQPIATFLEQTPWVYTTSGIMSSFEKREEVDRILKQELGPLYVDIPSFHETYFGQVAGIEAASRAVFEKCVKGSNPLFGPQGWRDWPAATSEKNVVDWFHDLFPQLEAFAQEWGVAPASTPASTPIPVQIPQRKLLIQPSTPLPDSVGKRSMDIGFVKDDPITAAASGSGYRWSHVLVPGELKIDASDDIPSVAWISIARYAREVLSASNTRRFVLAFTLCGSLMRLWEFDRLGGIASEQFDINKDGLRFVFTMLGFLWMDEEELGFDPTFKRTPSGQQFIEINRNGANEHLMIDGAIIHPHCIAGRATTCWKAHSEEDPRTILVIKDSWQFPERDVEGDLLRKATEKKVINMARYYHHEIVQVGGADDTILSNVRKGLDITKASNYKPDWTDFTLRAKSGSIQAGTPVTPLPSTKRPSSRTDAPLPPSKRSRLSQNPNEASTTTLPDREHRRIIVRDYGLPIYKASSPARLLTALESCIAGHESLYRAGFLHRDISINNLIINEDPDNPSWQSYLIDLDLAIEIQRDGISGAKSMTGTRAFIAIGALMGELHSFMHDIESFYWVLFWICIHYEGPGKERIVSEFDKWNFMDTNTLLKVKLGEINSSVFAQTSARNFTDYYRPLTIVVNKLRQVIFPGGDRWKHEDVGLYARVRKILAEGCIDPDVTALQDR